MNWNCKSTWRKAKKNTLWCLIGCSIGDFGTIFYFQNVNHSLSNFEVMSIAVINGILTSVLLETLILLKQMNFAVAVIWTQIWFNGNPGDSRRSPLAFPFRERSEKAAE